jgi:hypothetical protein
VSSSISEQNSIFYDGEKVTTGGATSTSGTATTNPVQIGFLNG